MNLPGEVAMFQLAANGSALSAMISLLCGVRMIVALPAPGKSPRPAQCQRVKRKIIIEASDSEQRVVIE